MQPGIDTPEEFARIRQNEQDAYEEECIREMIEMDLAIEQHEQDDRDAYQRFLICIIEADKRKQC